MNTLRLALFAMMFTAAAPAQEEREDKRPAPATPRARTAAELAAQTVVVFNKGDIDSLALAGLYAEKRAIPPGNLIGIECPRTEDISREDYDRTIAEPLRREFKVRKFWKLLDVETESGRVEETKIRFVVLMRGIPLRITAATAPYQGDNNEGTPAEIFQRNESCVDSEVAVLGLWSRRISGVLINPYYRETNVIQDTELTSQFLVARLDGPSAAVVKRMIEDTIAAEEKGLRGFTYVDARGIKGGQVQLGDNWMHQVARDARENGSPVILDDGPALFPNPYPMRHAAQYYGWYAEEVTGPFAQEGFKFQPGAVAVHLHSFSASTLRDARRYWCAPLVNAGAAATIGNVYEPYLALTSNLDIFAQRLREGFTFAEAGYMSIRFLSWMTTFVGDPLYRPFINTKPDPANEWDAYRAGVEVWLKKDRANGEVALRDAAKRLKSGVVSEALGLLELAGKDNAAAITAFQQARATYANAEDRIRVAVHESGAIAATKGDAEAAKFLREQSAVNAESSKAVVLSALAEIRVPSKKPKPAEKPKAR